MRILHSFLLALLFVPTAFATTYYVSNSGGDSSSGTTISTPWQTVSKVNSSAFNPGDVILFQAGGKWREEVHASSSGSVGLPITFSSYGAGEKPIFDGTDLLLSGWALDSGNIWKHALSPPYMEHLWVFFNGVAGGPNGGKPETAKVNVNAPNKWYWEANVLYVYSTSDPATAFTNPGVEATARGGFIVAGKHYITVSNLNVKRTTQSCFDILDSPHVTVDSSIASYCGKNGIVFYNFASNCDFFTSSNNVVSYVAESGTTTKDCSHGRIFGNDVSHVGIQKDDEDAIGTVGASGDNRLYDNYAHDNMDQIGSVGIRGIELDTIIGINNVNYVYNNVVARNNGTGIIVEHSIDQQVYNNISYDNARGPGSNCCVAGFKDSLGSRNIWTHNTGHHNQFAEMEITNDSGAGPKLRDNIFSGLRAILANGGTGGSTDTDYNLVVGSTLYNWNGTSYSSPAALFAATGKGQHDVTGDPLFVDVSAGNFQLRPGSPAIGVSSTGGTVGAVITTATSGAPDAPTGLKAVVQ